LLGAGDIEGATSLLVNASLDLFQFRGEFPLLLLETNCVKQKLESITDYGGQPLSKGVVLEGLAPYLEALAVEVS